MKVNIGPYKNYLTSNVHSNYMNKHYGLDWPEYGSKGLNNRVEPLREYFLERLEDTLQWIYDHSINLYLDKKQRKVKIRIDRYDTWSMDDTLALIILPMLKQLKESKHGYPSDLNEQEWDKILDEMIWAFEQKSKEIDAIDMCADKCTNYSDPVCISCIEETQERISNGFRLFGKYYEGLWD